MAALGMAAHMNDHRQAVRRGRCECADKACSGPHFGTGHCDARAQHTMRRVDMDSNARVRFCLECAIDAAQSGVFA